ncbi:peptidase S8 and S53 subtilisin kexin sedolisin [Actinomadura craniellae]|uniref:Peptidase S8 and S53 subtilisin kexin sedolisin n=1 Tax=Actinomadura craniellae TaxID=2231787 RepID=A0A365GYG0_9ACTN|nr:S8/S53 family peptidase [Actinomadura craniellae]RAY10963.1 peptidase S8 and S53 subtilisin kexin sedolisin [Actinomadura craniellae]
MSDREAWLERLLARHPDAVPVEALPGRPTLIRRDELLVAPEHAPTVEGLVRRWHDSRRDDPGGCLLRLRGPARVDVCDLAARLGAGSLAATPNHLVHGQPLWWSGPAGPPRPVPPVPAPVAGAGRRVVTVAVLDTGLSPHPWYERTGWYAEHPPDAAEVLDTDLDLELDSQAGHGTFVAGVLLQHAPAVRLRAHRVIGGDGIGDEFTVLRALARMGRPDIVNISLGCHTYDDRPSPVLGRALAALDGTVAVACAGNGATDRPFWPAALDQVIAVGALDGADRAWFSNHGPWVDACAPGVDVRSCHVRFPAAEDGDPPAFEGYAAWSGTSFAAPAVAGTIAALAAAHDLSARDAAARLLAPPTRTLPGLGAVVTEPRE